MVGDEQTNEVYLPLTSTVVLARKQKMLYVHLVFDKNLSEDALVDSGASLSAIALNELDTKKTESPEK